MKNLFVIFFTTGLLFCGNYLWSQEEVQTEEELDPLRYYKPKYEATYSAPIEVVADAVTKAIEDINCAIVQKKEKTDDEDGWIRWIIKSDFCVFVEGDSTFIKLQQQSYKMPFIRGGAWRNGRMQYKFVITEQPDDKVYLLLSGNMSGLEHFVTNRVHFWESNGQFEHDILQTIDKNIEVIWEEFKKKNE
ncbi:MAG: hypothetical protein V1779_14090 [bacterium]